MRWYVFFAAFIGLNCVASRGFAAADDSAAWRDRGLIARMHFVGTARIATDPNAAGFNDIAAMPETRALREQTLQKLAMAPYNFLRNRTATTNDESAHIRPMLEDLLRAESYIEVLDNTNHVPELMLAVRLDEGRACLWRTNLAAVLADWCGFPVTNAKSDGYDGWELRKHESPNLVRFFRAGEWVVVGWGDGELQLQKSTLQRIRQATRPVDPANDYWLDAWVNWPALVPHHLAPKSVKLPGTRLVIQGRKDFVRSQLVMKFGAPLELTLNPWQIPTNAIHNPIVSFTAVRGVSGYLDGLARAGGYSLPRLPDQLYVWASGSIPLATHLAAPVTDASNYLEQLQPGLVSLLNSYLSSHAAGPSPAGPVHPFKFEAVWTDGKVQIPGMPFVAPNLGAVRDPAGDYLLGGLMPATKSVQPLPSDLIREIHAHDNLVGYDWEFTEERLKQWHGLMQLWHLLFTTEAADPDGKASKWIEAVWSKLGNCGTEVTLTAPDQLTVVRNSAIGFTAFELSEISYWLDAPGFPLSAGGEAPRWHPLPNSLPHTP